MKSSFTEIIPRHRAVTGGAEEFPINKGH